MAHIVQIQAEVWDPVAVASARNRLKLPELAQDTSKLFSSDAPG